MPSYYDQLPPNADRVAISAAVREVINGLYEVLTLSEIAESVNRLISHAPIKTNALKLFLHRPTGARVNAQNSILPALYDFIQAHYDKLPEPAYGIVHKYADIFGPHHVSDIDGDAISLLRPLALGAYSWLHVDVRAIKSLAERFSGNFVFLRKSSVYPKVVIKSSINIALSDSSDVLAARHNFTDRLDMDRISHGLFLPVKDNVYALFAVEGREALEFFGFSHPIQSRTIDKMTGFSISVDLNRTLIAARVFIERENPAWDELPKRFSVEDEEIRKNKYIMSIVEYLDEGTSLSAAR